MTKEVTVKNTGSIGILGFMFLIMFTLKLCSVEPVANWSWWWITAPIWGPISLLLAICVVCMLAWVVCHFIEMAARR